MLTLRNATMADAQLLFDWRNDPATRAASHNTAPLEFTAHCAWLEKAVHRIRIAEVDGAAVGTVRIDRGASTELSWTIAPGKRGLGYGKEMVIAAIALCEGHVRAEIKSGNIASQRIAESAGMSLVRRDGDALHYETVSAVHGG